MEPTLGLVQSYPTLDFLRIRLPHNTSLHGAGLDIACIDSSIRVAM